MAAGKVLMRIKPRRLLPDLRLDLHQVREGRVA
jgi:hypothetical protein